jgi:hypothetical protein
VGLYYVGCVVSSKAKGVGSNVSPCDGGEESKRTRWQEPEVLRLKAAILELVGECAGYVILAVTWMRE